MSNLATAGHLREAVSQFPVAWYCDPHVFDAEMRQLFQHRQHQLQPLLLDQRIDQRRLSDVRPPCEGDLGWAFRW